MTRGRADLAVRRGGGASVLKVLVRVIVVMIVVMIVAVLLGFRVVPQDAGGFAAGQGRNAFEKLFGAGMVRCRDGIGSGLDRAINENFNAHDIVRHVSTSS
jgi:hypothetical protein